MAKINRLKKILSAFPIDTKVDFSSLDGEINKLKDQLKEKVQIKTIDDVNVQLDKFKKKLDFTPIFTAVEDIEKNILDRFDELSTELDQKDSELQSLISSKDKNSLLRIADLKIEISDLQSQISSLEVTRKSDLEKIKKSIPDLTDLQNEIEDSVTMLSSRLDTLEGQEIDDWSKKIDKVRTELLGRINSIGGGSMNRQIFIGGADPLTKYTDINLKAGAGTTITYTNNDTTKKVDVTLTGSAGSGIVRTVTSTSVSSVVGAVAATDYVVICTAGVQVTLPTAVSNTNLYIIKNVSTSSVLVATTGGQTIDGSANLILATQYTSVDLISDTANWDIT